MKVISIGTDRKLFEEGSAVRARAIEYGKHVDEYHIIVYSLSSLGLQPWRIADNVWIYPTNSMFKLFYMSGARSIAWKIIKLRKFSPADTIVTAQDPFECGMVASDIHNSFKFPLQLQVHTDFLSDHFINESKLNKYRVKKAKQILPYAQEIRVVSERIKQSIVAELKLLPEHIDVLPIFTDLKRLEAKPTFSLLARFHQFTFIILMVGRLAPEKNYGLALEVLKKLRETYPKVGLVIVGEGPEEASLKKKAQELGVADAVIFEHWQNDLASYYKTAQAFMHTSDYEGYSLVLVEAAVSGLPIVTTHVGVVGELLQDNRSALVCDPPTVDAFYVRLKKIIEDNAFREQLRGAVLEDVAHMHAMTEEQYFSKYYELWEKTLKNGQQQ